MECLKCDSENEAGAKFCNECGAKLEIHCPQCGKENRPGSKFCNECGHNLTSSSTPPPKDLSFDEKLDKIQRYLPRGLTEKILSQRDKIEGERKQVTVMFCDMEGFTSSGSADSELRKPTGSWTRSMSFSSTRSTTTRERSTR